MTRRMLPCLVLAAVIPLGCQNGDTTNGKSMTETDTTMADDGGARVSLEGMRNIMQAKLVHANTLLESIALEDFAAIEHNANALTWLSQESDWQVHTTVAYGVFSDQFREVTAQMARHARERNIEAISTDYEILTETCLKCHAYLRREGLISNLPSQASLDVDQPVAMLNDLR